MLPTAAPFGRPELPAPRRVPRSVPAAAGLALAGIGGVVAGTFLPWLVSGGVQRNSYAIVGVVDRLGLVHNAAAGVALELWPVIGAVAMAPVVAGILGWWRTAGLAALLFGLLTSLIGAGVLTAARGHGGAGVALAPAGPVTTVCGAAATMVGAGAVLALSRRHRRGPAVSPDTPAVPDGRMVGRPAAPATGGPFRTDAATGRFESAHPSHRAGHSSAAPASGNRRGTTS